ncbi:MAG: ribbon-helix-helix protein, CopG family [Alteromonadaceae bacterium]|nr:ribbon-helix-helix protein, CopG family [Alteromonadaceae bacterium]
MFDVILDSELENRLAALAERTHRSISHHAKIALERYIEQEEAKERADSESLLRWEAYKEDGEFINNQSVMNWLDTWGTDQETIRTETPLITIYNNKFVCKN